MKTKNWIHVSALSALFLAVASCGGDTSQSSNRPGSGDEFANGGIGGSGSGTVSDYGSIIFNGIGENGREFQVEAHTLLTLDGVQIPFVDGHSELPLGATAEFLIGEDVEENMTGGTATAIRAFHQVIGPITNVSPLEVFGQPVVIEDGTVLGDRPDCLIDPENVSLNQVIAVAGAIDQNGKIKATRFVDAECDAVTTEWKIRGRVANSAANEFTLGGQSITTLGTIYTNCPVSLPLPDGQKVLVTTPRGIPADSLNANEVECLSEGLTILNGYPEVPDNLPVSYSGVITDGRALPLVEFVAKGRVILEIDGQKVRISALNLEVVTGTLGVDALLQALIPGARIDVDGTLGSDGIIDAKHVNLLDDLTGVITDILGGLLGGLVQTSGENAQYISSPLVDAPFESFSADSSMEVSLLKLSANNESQIEIVAVGPSQPGSQILAALQIGNEVAFPTAGEVAFERRMVALRN